MVQWAYLADPEAVISIEIDIHNSGYSDTEVYSSEVNEVPMTVCLKAPGVNSV